MKPWRSRVGLFHGVRVPTEFGMREQLLPNGRPSLRNSRPLRSLSQTDVLGAGMGQGAARRLAELIHIHKVAMRGRLMARLAVVDAILRGSDDP